MTAESSLVGAAGSPAAAASGAPAFRLTRSTVTMLSLAAIAWVGVVAYARDMGNGRGTMGLPLAEFLPMWAVMMAAMMLPAVAPVGSLYARTITSDRAKRLTVFVGGYLVAWALAGVPAYVVLRLVDHYAGDADSAMRVVAALALVAAGVYQLTPLKTRCLRHCRSPLGQLLRYGNMTGRFRDLKVATHHAAYCLGCCWALMALFVVFGVMNVWAMVGLAALVVSEKVLRRGEVVGRLVGAMFVVLAVLVLASPTVARRVVPGGSMTSMDTSMSMPG